MDRVDLMHHVAPVVQVEQLGSAPDRPAQRKDDRSASKPEALDEGEVGEAVDLLAELPLQVLLQRLTVGIPGLLGIEDGLIGVLRLEVFRELGSDDFLFPERGLNAQGEIVLLPALRADEHSVCALYLVIDLLRVLGHIRVVEFGLEDVLLLYFLEVGALSHL